MAFAFYWRYTGFVIWFIIWLAFALFMAWLFARSMRTVWKQQRAWRMFAAKYKLGYDRPFWYKAPSLEGEIQGRRIRIYVDEVVDPVLRVREFRTTIEAYFKTGFATGIALGSRGFHATIQGISNVEAMSLPNDTAFSGLVAVGRDTDLARAYLEVHAVPLKRFFALPKTERLLMGYEEEGFLVLQSAAPLDEAKTLNAMVKQIFALADALEPHFGENTPEEAAPEEETLPLPLENPVEDENSVVIQEPVSVEEEAAIMPEPEQESEAKP